MKKNKGIVYKRQQQILQRLKDDHTVHVNTLANELAVTPITIRRDLQLFEDRGIVTRFHGGATLREGVSLLDDTPASTNEGQPQSRQKELIAQYAASIIDHGDTVFLNSSSTALLILKYLKGKRVIVVTNNCNALNAERGASVELVFTGGEIYHRKQSMVGDLAAHALSRIVANKSFIGVSGISAQQGVTTSVLQETAINEIMMKRSNGNCYVLADATKIGKQSNFFSGSIQMVNQLITDQAADPQQLALIRNSGVQIIQV